MKPFDCAFSSHGGSDALGAPRFDFSTNSNACGPCPAAHLAVQQADATRYPDPSFTGLRRRLADFHGVDVARVLLAGSASEFIFRITAWAAQQGARRVHLPAHHYGDYARAAQGWGLERSDRPEDVQLWWACEPSSPLGQAQPGWPGKSPTVPTVVLDRAYAPLRLSGKSSFSQAELDQVWQLFTPNKALGLTGVRAAYVIAPLHAQAQALALQTLAPSWPVGAHGVAMLASWVQPEVQDWLVACLDTLRTWKRRQLSLLARLGWACLPSEANYFCARPPQRLDLNALRQTHGIKLRDASSFGLPGWYRLGVLSPSAQDALDRALTHDPAKRDRLMESLT